jgi:hypothetical protein
LTVSGNIERPTDGAAATFNRAALRRLGTVTLRTSTIWTDGRPEFEGVLARDVLEAVGARGETVTAGALNDYVADIPIEDFYRYDVLLALEQDGVELTLRDRGPIWIVYPRDQHPELQDPLHDQKMVWQLEELQVR